MELIIEGKALDSDEIKKYVSDYKKEMLQNHQSRYYHVLNNIPEQLYGLDYGCGWGSFTKNLAEKSKRVIGIDHSKNEIEICKYCWKESEALKFIQGDISQFEDDEFDFVVSNEVLEHVHNPGNYLHQINRVLKSEGLLIISIPNILNPRFFLMPLSNRYEGYLKKVSHTVLDEYDKTNTHINSWDPYHFVNLLASVGFVLKKYEPLEGVPLPQQVSKIKIPTYINFKGRLKGWSYTSLFVFEKVKCSHIRHLD